MLMKDDKHKMATIIVSKMRDGKSMEPKLEKSGEEMHDADEMYMIADDVMKSIQDGDVRSLKKSLEAFIRCCSDKDDSSESMSHNDESSEY
jgi:hypothetical protein